MMGWEELLKLGNQSQQEIEGKSIAVQWRRQREIRLLIIAKCLKRMGGEYRYQTIPKIMMAEIQGFLFRSHRDFICAFGLKQPLYLLQSGCNQDLQRSLGEESFSTEVKFKQEIDRLWAHEKVVKLSEKKQFLFGRRLILATEMHVLNIWERIEMRATSRFFRTRCMKFESFLKGSFDFAIQLALSVTKSAPIEIQIIDRVQRSDRYYEIFEELKIMCSREPSTGWQRMLSYQYRLGIMKDLMDLTAGIQFIVRSGSGNKWKQYLLLDLRSQRSQNDRGFGFYYDIHEGCLTQEHIVGKTVFRNGFFVEYRSQEKWGLSCQRFDVWKRTQSKDRRGILKKQENYSKSQLFWLKNTGQIGQI